MASEPDALDQAVESLCLALRAHADVVRASASNPETIVRSGEVVSRAVLEHEAVLMQVAGWSSPLRHLGTLPFYGQLPGDASADRGEGFSVEVSARYVLRISDIDAVVAAARGRFADDRIVSLPVALRRLVQAEGWDPTQVAGGLITVAEAEVTIDG